MSRTMEWFPSLCKYCDIRHPSGMCENSEYIPFANFPPFPISNLKISVEAFEALNEEAQMLIEQQHTMTWEYEDI